MPKHTWSFSVKSDAGSGPVNSLVVSESCEVNIGNSGVSTCQVGVQDVVEVDVPTITASKIVSFFIGSDQPMRVRTNSEVSPSQEFNLLANKAMGWNNADLPHGFTNPITVDITKLFFYNAGTKTANVQAGFLLNQDSVFS